MTRNNIVGIGLVVLIFAIGIAAFFAFPSTPQIDKGNVLTPITATSTVVQPTDDEVVSDTIASTTVGTSTIPLSGSNVFPRNTEWVWVRTTVPGGKVAAPKAGKTFRISFDGAGRFSVKGDCNSIAGQYIVWAPGDVSMENIIATEMYCEDSQELDFINTLSRVTAYKVMQNTTEGESLVFDIEGDIAGYGVMTFAKVSTTN